MRISITKRQRALALIKIIERQCPQSPSARLFFAVFAQAVQDAFILEQKDSNMPDIRSARRYLRGSMQHLDLLGIDSDWVRRKIKDAGLSI
jgi:hypothetical protein